ncbi:hypothetical protein CK203_006606 [Vitis vinifera]|uniref:DUF4283 domain-containing protein n=1 Tax=Vitis vinifera TaxID=29760 RepID=A0A438KBV1_VITVI|nr:hypothetical protein CK203_006606 [Vitis vinifera]
MKFSMGERERESEREREGERERESACDGDDEETGEASRRRSFTVESKTFELALDDRKGKRQFRIVEKKRGVSTWVRLGLESLGLFKKGLIHCIRDDEEERWEKEWKEGGKLYTLARGFNRAGVYLRLGVVGLERKRFCIFLPRGRRGKRGWTAMVEMVRQMEEMAGRRTEVQEVRTVGRANPAKSYVEAVRRTNWDGLNAIKMRVTREEIAGNLQKLEHCLVVSWKSEKEEEDDLERLGSLWANSWGLKGKLGLAKLERGKALLEFEDLSEACRVASSGSRLLGGAHLGLELWNPKTGCRVEEEMEQIAWVRIYGLPISLWSLGTLKKIGEECRGFVDMDERIRSMGEIQWARILVKTKGDFRPSLLEIEVEDEIYSVALWWEIRPVVKRPFSATENRRNKEVRGELHSRAEKRVGKELVGAGIEELQTSVDGSDLQENGPGPAPGLQFQGQENRDWASPIGRMAGPAASGPNMGLSWLKKDGGLNKMDGLLGRKLKNKPKVNDYSEAGPSWAAEMGCNQLTEVEGPEREGPIAPLEKAGFLGRFSSRKGPNSEDPLISWVIEEPRREQGDVGLSMTDRALEEEVKRYALNPYPKVGRDSKNRDKAKDKEGNNGGSVSQDTENEKEDPWEECSLAKFSQFLGFSTEGLEKEILSFLIKIRKRREKIHSKELLEKSKFERELKRLECSVNYEGGNRQKGNQDSGDVGGYCEKFGTGEILRLESPKCGRGCGWHIDMLDKRVLEILDWEEGQFSLSCRFKITENGAIWVFTGVYGPFTKVEREGMWEELGAIRGLWGDPWCLGGDNITLFQHERSSQRRISSAMRRFAQIVDDLELVDLPLQGGEFTWSGGLNNQAWARLDRFLVSPSWLDQFSGVTQGRLSRPTSDHFPIVLEGGGVRRGPTPFRFENMWLKVEGFNDIIRTWWQEIEVRGSASYRLAVKMKEIKKKLKVWNKEVLGGWKLTKLQPYIN